MDPVSHPGILTLSKVRSLSTCLPVRARFRKVGIFTNILPLLVNVSFEKLRACLRRA